MCFISMINGQTWKFSLALTVCELRILLCFITVYYKVIVLCFIVCYFMSILVCNYLDGEERTGCFAKYVFLMSRDCCVSLPCGAIGLSANCDCGIS